ncbi:MAG: hypothetical protein JNL60_07680 [Bacteroidia bacterium]|nr:hypothetical protein [Bacteroidia bacterium]
MRDLGSSLENKRWWSLLKDNRFVFIHLFFWLCIYLLLGLFNWVKNMPDNGNVSWYDAGWYRSIRDGGYQYHSDQQSNVAFFPLFPLIWKILHLNNIRMGLINWLICFLSMVMLKKSLKLQTRETLLFLSLPSMMFMYLPYTEATFLFFCSVFLIGMYEKRTSWILVGLFFSSLVRPTAMFYIPALIFSEFVVARANGENFKAPLKRILLYSGISALALLLVAIVQRYQTGEWFLFFEVQGQFWNHKLTMPQLPFTTWDEARILWLDGIALAFGIMAFLFCIVWKFRALFRRFENQNSPPAIVLFSAVFLSLSTFSVVFFDARDSPEGTTLLSLNRYILASPFFIVFLWHILKPGEFLKEYFILLLISAAIVWYCLYPVTEFEGLKQHVLHKNKAELYLGGICVYLGLYLLMKFKEIRSELIGGVYCLNLVLQLYLLNEFLKQNWVG